MHKGDIMLIPTDETNIVRLIKDQQYEQAVNYLDIKVSSFRPENLDIVNQAISLLLKYFSMIIPATKQTAQKISFFQKLKINISKLQQMNEEAAIRNKEEMDKLVKHVIEAAYSEVDLFLKKNDLESLNKNNMEFIEEATKLTSLVFDTFSSDELLMNNFNSQIFHSFAENLYSTNYADIKKLNRNFIEAEAYKRAIKCLDFVDNSVCKKMNIDGIEIKKLLADIHFDLGENLCERAKNAVNNKNYPKAMELREEAQSHFVMSKSIYELLLSLSEVSENKKKFQHDIDSTEKKIQSIFNLLLQMQNPKNPSQNKTEKSTQPSRKKQKKNNSTPKDNIQSDKGANPEFINIQDFEENRELPTKISIEEYPPPANVMIHEIPSVPPSDNDMDITNPPLSPISQQLLFDAKQKETLLSELVRQRENVHNQVEELQRERREKLQHINQALAIKIKEETLKLEQEQEELKKERVLQQKFR